MALAVYTFTLPIPDIAAAGSDHGYLPALPEALTLKAAQIVLDTVDCTGAGAAASAVVNADPDGTPVALSDTLTIHVTNDNQHLSFVTKKSSVANVASGVKIGVKVTLAGATTAATTGVYAIVVFGRPENPA